MRLAITLFLWSLSSALALDNSVTVINASGSDQTNLPVTVGRYFAQGEMTLAGAQPYIGGAAATTWQSDVHNTWPDGSLRFVTISFQVPLLTSTGSAIVDFRPSSSTSSGAGLTKTASLAVTWNAEIGWWFNKGTANEIGGTINAVSMMTAIAESGCGVRKWLDGAVVTEWIVEDICVGDSFDWGAQWDDADSKWVAAPSTTYKSLHPIFHVAIYPNYPSTGQYTVKVQEIIENMWLSRRQNQVFSFELRTGAGPTVIESQDPYTMPHGTRFRFDGWGNTNSIPDYIVDPNLPYLIYTKAIPAIETESVTPDGAVIGQAGADTEIHNSGPNASQSYETHLGTYNGVPERPQYCRAVVNSCRNSSGCCAQWTKPLTSPGAGPELAPIARFYMRWLYLVRNPSISTALKLLYWKEPFIGNAHASTNAPLHFRDDGAGAAFCPNNCYTAPMQAVDIHGRVFSIDAHPTLSLWNGQANPYTTVAGCTTGMPCMPTTNSWSTLTAGDAVHAYSTGFLPAILTGEQYWAEEMLFWAAWGVGGGNPANTQPNTRNGRFGYLANAGGSGIRAQAWHLRNIAQAAALASSNTPEPEYFKRILDYNIEIEEGFNSLTTADGANFYEPAPGCTAPCKTVPWRWGQDVVRPMYYDGTIRPNLGNPLHYMQKSTSSGTNVISAGQANDTTKTYSNGVPWMDAYEAICLSIARDMGFPEVSGLQNIISRPLIRMVLDPAQNPFVAQTYQWPVGKMAGTRLAITAATKSGTTITYSTAPAAHGYSTGDQITVCCVSTTVAGGWYITNVYPLPIVVLDATTFSITSSLYTTSITGSYPGGMYCIPGNQTVNSPIGDGGYFQTDADRFDALNPDEKADAFFRVGNMNSRDGGYAIIAMAHLATAAQWGITSGPYTAQKAYDWIRTNVGYSQFAFGNFTTCAYTNIYCQNPNWMLVPRPTIANLTTEIGSGSVVFRFTNPTGEAHVQVSTSPITTTMDGSDTAATCQSRQCSAVLTTNPGTTYYYRVTGGAMGGTARVYGTFTTVAAGAPTTFPIFLTPPSGRGIADVIVDYGPTSAYGSSTSPVSCSTGCTVNVTATSASLLYTRWRYRNGSAVVVATGSRVGVVQ